MQLTLQKIQVCERSSYCITPEAAQALKLEYTSGLVVCSEWVADNFHTTARKIQVQFGRRPFKGSTCVKIEQFLAIGCTITVHGHTESRGVYSFIRRNFQPGAYYVKVTPCES